MQDFDIFLDEGKARLSLFQSGGGSVSILCHFSGLRIFSRIDTVIADQEMTRKLIEAELKKTNSALEKSYGDECVFAKLENIEMGKVVLTIEISIYGMSGQLFVEQGRHKPIVSAIWSKVLIPF